MSNQAQPPAPSNNKPGTSQPANNNNAKNSLQNATTAQNKAPSQSVTELKLNNRELSPQEKSRIEQQLKREKKTKEQRDAARLKQKEYFNNLVQTVQKEMNEEEKELAIKSVSENIQRVQDLIIDGKIGIEGTVFKKVNAIEGDIIDLEYRQIQEEEKVLQNKLREVNGLINELIQEKAISNIVEDHVIDKKIKDLQYNRAILKKELSENQRTQEKLNSELITNPRSAYSHPVMKMYLEEENQKKALEAKKFLNDMKEKMKKEIGQIKQIDEQIKKKKLDKVLEEHKLDIDQRLKKNKQMEVAYKQQIEDIQARHKIRKEKVKKEEDDYQKQREKLLRDKKPLHIRKNKEFREKQRFERKQQAQTAFDEIRKNHPLVEQLNLTEHEKLWKEKLKEKEEEFKKKRKDELDKLYAPQSFPKITYQSKLWKVSEDNFRKIMQNTEEQKAREQQARQARIRFAQGIKDNIEVPVNDGILTQLQIQREKRQNPLKYITPLHRKQYDEFFRPKLKEEDQEIDLNPVKNEIEDTEQSKASQIQRKYYESFKSDNGTCNPLDHKGVNKLGHQYLMEMHKQYPARDNAQSQIGEASRYGQSVDEQSAYDSRYKIPELGYSQSTQSMQTYKIDYMNEIRLKYQLTEKANRSRKLDKLSLESLPPIEKQNQVRLFVQKNEEEAKNKQRLLKSKQYGSGLLSTKQAEERQEIDNLYYNSIKAQLALLSTPFDQNNGGTGGGGNEGGAPPKEGTGQQGTNSNTNQQPPKNNTNTNGGQSNPPPGNNSSGNPSSKPKKPTEGGGQGQNP